MWVTEWGCCCCVCLDLSVHRVLPTAGMCCCSALGLWGLNFGKSAHRRSTNFTYLFRTQAASLASELTRAEAAAAAAAQQADADKALRAKLEAKLKKAEQQAAALARQEEQQRQEAARLKTAAEEAKEVAAAGAQEGADDPELVRLQGEHALAKLAADQAAAAAAAAADRLSSCQQHVEAIQAAQARSAAAIASKLEASAAAGSQVAEALAAAADADSATSQAESAWCAARTQLAVLQGQLQEARAGVAALSAARDASAGASNGGRWAAYDEAVVDVAQRGAAGQLPGRFFGRVCNVARLAAGADAAAGVAVNAVLHEVGARLVGFALWVIGWGGDCLQLTVGNGMISDADVAGCKSMLLTTVLSLSFVYINFTAGLTVMPDENGNDSATYLGQHCRCPAPF